MQDTWLTYSDASERLGVKVASVKRTARAKKWARRTMNDGTVQVCVPADRLPDIRADDPEDRPPVSSAPDQSSEILARLAASEARLEMSERRATELAEDRDRWRSMAERLSERQSVSFLDRLFRR